MPQKKILILNLLSPYNSLYSAGIQELEEIYDKIIIITDSKLEKYNLQNIHFIHCKKIKTSNFSKKLNETWIRDALNYDRYCTYYPASLFFPLKITTLFKFYTINAIKKIIDVLDNEICTQDQIFFISEPPANAIVIYLDYYLRDMKHKPIYITSSRIVSGHSIATHSNLGDSGSIDLKFPSSETPIATRTSARRTLDHRTNRSLFEKISNLIFSSSKTATSIYPNILFYYFLCIRQFASKLRWLYFRYLIPSYSISHFRNNPIFLKIGVVYLHFEPEVSTLFWSRDISSQVEWVCSLAQKNNGMIFLVREHKHFKGYRPIRDYKEMLSRKNVYMAKNDALTELIKSEAEIYSFSGTIGYELAQLGAFHKFNFVGKPFYEELITTDKKVIDEIKLEKFLKKTFSLEFDPAMEEFGSTTNKSNFVTMLKQVARYVY